MMLLCLIIIFQFFYSVTCQISCYICPGGVNTFDSILTADTVPESLKNCSFVDQQTDCSIYVRWSQTPDQTSVTLSPGGERKKGANEHNLQNTISLSNNGIQFQWTKVISYTCFTEQCNGPLILKRLLRSLKSEDQFQTLSNLLTMNPQFSSSLCFFFANSSVPCETEMDPTTCKQCAAEEYIQSKSLEMCANCEVNNVTENSMMREVKFFMETRIKHDFWMVNCQQDGCNKVETGNLIREKSDIQFNFDLFLNGSNKLKSISSTGIIILALIVLNKCLY